VKEIIITLHFNGRVGLVWDRKGMASRAPIALVGELIVEEDMAAINDKHGSLYVLESTAQKEFQLRFTGVAVFGWKPREGV